MLFYLTSIIQVVPEAFTVDVRLSISSNVVFGMGDPSDAVFLALKSDLSLRGNSRHVAIVTWQGEVQGRLSRGRIIRNAFA